MGSCLACGAPAELGDRFCSACGHTLDGAGPDLWATPADGWAATTPGLGIDEPELIMVERPAPSSAPAHAGVAPRGPGRRSRPAWLTAAVLALAVWAIGRAGGAQTDSGSGPGATTPTGGSAAATVDYSGSPGPSDRSGPADGGTEPTPWPSGPEPVVTSGSQSATHSTADGRDDPHAGPVLGHPVGWSLVIGSPFSTGITRLDLDTGQQVTFEEARGGPAAAIDGRVILVTAGPAGLRLRIVPDDELMADGIVIEVGDSPLITPWPVAAAGDGNLWVYTSTEAATAWRLIRLRDGRQLDEVPAAPYYQAVPVAGAGPEVSGSAGGGVYRRQGDGYVWLGPGSPVAVSRGAVLIRECSAPTVCPMRWLDADSGQAVDRPVPPAASDATWVGLPDSSGRFLFGFRTTHGEPFASWLLMYDLETRIATKIGPSSVETGRFAASPDGRVLAVHAGQRLHLYDVEQDQWAEVELPSDPGVDVVFVPNGAVP